MKKLLPVIVLLIHSCSLQAQRVEDRLNTWAEKNRIEKVYLHLDRENYFSGQDIWFKAYFMADFLPSSISSSLFVELLEGEGNVIQREVFPVYWGVSQGQISLKNNIASGNYTLRAYAPVMLNQSDFLFTKRIIVFGTELNPDKKTATNSLQVSFFPEGGNLITGLANNIAFKAIDENGRPANISIDIENSAGKAFTTAHCLHDGMGVFSLLPIAGEKYYAIKPDTKERYPLPESTVKGVAVQLRQSDRGIAFKIEQPGNNRAFEPAYMIGQMQNRSVFRKDFHTNKNTVNGVVQTTSLPSGILQITVFNDNNIPLAERLVFVNNREYILPAQVIANSNDVRKRKLNQFSLKLQGSISGSFSVSVTDADIEDTLPRPQNIYSSLLLTSDIKGHVHRPAWYFTSTGDSVEQALDLVMMTNGWRRYKWSDVVNNTLPAPIFTDNGFIKISGKAILRDRKKPFEHEDLLLMISPKDTVTNRRKYSQIIQTDAQGNFTVDSLVFYDHSKLLFSDVKGGKSKFLTIKLDADTLRRKYPVPQLAITADSYETERLNNQTILSAYKEHLNGLGTILENVTVSGRIKTKLQELDEYYTSGSFARGIMARTFDLTEEPHGSMNVLDYLAVKVPGISVVKQDYYHIFYRKPLTMQVIKPLMGETSTPNSFGNTTPNEMSLFLDEMPVEPDFLASIFLKDIAYIKIFPTFSGAAGGGPDGTLAVYLKKGESRYNKIETAPDIISYEGYSIIKEFYSLDYSNPDKSDAKKDTRQTLLWEPNIFINDINPGFPIRFYNNDRTKRFKIVAEGITNDGKLLMIEKVIN